MKPVKKIIKKTEEKTDPRAGHTWGTWVERPRRAEIVMCECGNKYIKTRKNQTRCLRCLSFEANK